MYLISTLEKIEINELFSSVVLVLAALFAIYEIYKKVSGMYDQAYRVRKQREQEKEMLIKHERELTSISEKLDIVLEKLDMQDKKTKESNVANFKYDLYNMYEKCTKKGFATEEEMKCYLEKEKIYLASGGNDFVHDKIHPFMMSLPQKESNDVL